MVGSVVNKILLLTTPFRPNVGGVETHLDDLVSEGTKRGLNFLIFTYQPLITNAYGKTIEKGKGFTIVRIPWIRANLFLILEKYPALEFLYLFPGLFLLSFFYLLFKGQNIGTIHGQGLIAGTVGVFLGKLFKKRIIISTHSVYNFSKTGFYSSFVRRLFQGCDQVLTLSNQSKEEVISLGVDNEKVSVFRYWVDQKTFKKINQNFCRRKLNLPDAPICLFVGRLIEVKGVRELLKAAAISKETIHFLIIGDGYLAGEVKHAAWENPKIMFIGRIDNQELPYYYNASNVLVVPSTHEEGFGRVILEALSCGLPVIGANRGGIKESVSKDVGILIEVSPRNIQKAVEEILGNPAQLKKMSRNAISFAKKNYSTSNAEMIFKFYER